MKKRILCIIMMLVMIVPFILTSCGEDEKDLMKDIILGGEDEEIDRALTLSIWLPTDAITIEGKTADLSELTQEEKVQLQNEYPDVFEFLKRVDAVEEAINKELISRNYYTNIDIVPINNEYYEEAIAERFAKMDAESDPFDMNSRGDSDEYANEVTEETVGNNVLYNLLYRPVDDNQLDIFIIRDYGEYDGYELYRDYIDKNYLLPLNKTTEPNETNKFPKTNYITTSGTYASINKLIRDEFMDQMMVDDLLYALPNNHLYSSQKFFAIDKQIFNDYASEFNIKDFDDFSNIVAYINKVALSENDGVVPFFAECGLPAFDLVDLDNLTYGDNALNEIFNDEGFIEFVRAYKSLEENGLVTPLFSIGETPAVRLFEGTDVTINQLSDSCYLIPVGEHNVAADEVYSSMFAISTFTLDYDRAMKVLNLLVSDSKIVTMLQYGIENEDYSISTEERDGKEVEILNLDKDTAYLMNNLYTGSSYYTYPGDGTALNDWDAVKASNVKACVSKYANADYYLEKADLSDEDLAILAQKDEFKLLAQSAFEEISNMTLAEFDAFIATIQGEEPSGTSDSILFALSEYYSQLIGLYEKVM